MLDHDGVFVLRDSLERHDVRQGFFGDNDAGGVGPGVAGKALYLEGRVKNTLRLAVLLDELDHLPRRSQVLLAGRVSAVLLPQHVPQSGPDRLLWYELGELVGRLVRVLEYASGVPDRGFRPKRSKGNYLCDVLVSAILLGDVPHHLATPLDREVYIHIGHADPVRVQEPLEEE